MISTYIHIYIYSRIDDERTWMEAIVFLITRAKSRPRSSGAAAADPSF
jgi:hypothetical protein